MPFPPGSGFFDLHAPAQPYSLIDLDVKTVGDLHIDQHHDEMPYLWRSAEERSQKA